MFRSIKTLTIVAVLAMSSAAHANVILNTSADLRFTDVRDNQGKYFHVHQVFLEAGRHYTFDMSSQHFDTFLKLTNPMGVVVRQNDDSGPGLNARITFTPFVSGMFRLVATSYQARATGSYRVVVQRTDGMILNTHGDLYYGDPTVGSKHRKVYAVNLVAGRRYEINMHSQHFDTVVMLGRGGMIVAANDDGGPGRDSRLVFTPITSGTFEVIATSYQAGATGHFSLSVRD